MRILILGYYGQEVEYTIGEKNLALSRENYQQIGLTSRRQVEYKGKSILDKHRREDEDLAREAAARGANAFAKYIGIKLSSRAAQTVLLLNVNPGTLEDLVRRKAKSI